MKQSMYFRIALCLVLPLLFSMPGCQVVDISSSLTGISGSTTAHLAIGSNENAIAKGVMQSTENTIGLFLEDSETSGSLDNARRLATGSSVYGNAYLGIAQEDVFYYSRNYNVKQFSVDQTVDKDLLAISARCKSIITLYSKNVYLLVRKSVTDVSTENSTFQTNAANYPVFSLSGHSVNIGTFESDTYITAQTIITAYDAAFKGTGAEFLCSEEREGDAEQGIQDVIDGTVDAAFFVDVPGSSTITSIPYSDDYTLLKVTMPANRKYYSETATLSYDTYPLLKDASITGSIMVETLLIAGNKFNDEKVDLLISDIFENATTYAQADPRWEKVSASNCNNFILRFPQLCNYKAICAISGYPVMNEDQLQNGFYSGTADSVSHKMAVELIWLLSHNLDIDLKEQNSTGGWENAYRMFTGSASLAMVNDGIFGSLTDKNSMYESVMIASMKKVIPLNEEYVHLAVQKGSTLTSIGSIENMSGIKTINLGPKTSGTFIAAARILKAYSDENVNLSKLGAIVYCYDSEADGVNKVQSGAYTAAFVTSGIPYERFYSHDTYAGATNCRLVQADFPWYHNVFPYRSGYLAGNGNPTIEDYPYDGALFAADVKNGFKTTAVRNVLVASPAFKTANIGTYIKSIFRFAQYETEPADPAWWADEWYQPNFPWIAVRKETVTSYKVNDDVTVSENMIGAREYFVNDPFGWLDEAADYYLTMF
jgi:TRAP-type uncharacterized transport system substrate-binding protein